MIITNKAPTELQVKMETVYKGVILRRMYIM